MKLQELTQIPSGPNTPVSTASSVEQRGALAKLHSRHS